MLQRQSPLILALPPLAVANRPRVPPCWLMTDARLGLALPAIIARMPPRSAVVVRPYALNFTTRDSAGRTIDGEDMPAQHTLIRRIRRIARAKRHLVLIAGHYSMAGYDGRHGLFAGGLCNKGLFQSLAVHDAREAQRARRLKAHAVLISPIFATRSHANARPIGVRRFARFAAMSSPASAIALGGMTRTRFVMMRRHGARGWAAIDAWGKNLSA